MLVVDTSAFISLGTCGLTQIFLKEFEINTSQAVIKELEEISEYDDREAKAAQEVLDQKKMIDIHEVGESGDFKHSRIDRGEGSCAVLAKNLGSDFLVTDDIRALPYLKNISSTKVVISPIVLKALVKRDVMTEKEAMRKVEIMMNARDWFETPIYEKALELF